MDQEIRNAYFAGLIDGSGSIGMMSTGTEKPRRLEIKADSTCRASLTALRDHFGAGSVRPKKGTHGHHLQWRWRVTHAAARIVLSKIRPYLIVRADQAKSVDAITKKKGAAL